ncbi:DUF4931 domain-containing protein [Bacillus bombysepticus]|uniref:DUF4931 domain-containing protein n=1 Tax=Bacillus bombysepticus TaxID=658666 RepID=UPI0030171FBD
MNSYIACNMGMAKTKPNTYREEIKCPFCDFEALEKEDRVVERRGDMLLLRNKFPVFENTDAYVLVESSSCEEHFHTMSKEKLVDLVRFATDSWESAQSNPVYQSVILFKNFGPNSAGSIKHSHMQVICFKDNISQELESIHTEGVEVSSFGEAKLILSEHPLNEGYEVYAIGENIDEISVLAQSAAKYFANDFPTKSYNLTFHQLNNKNVIRITPCVKHTPLFLGFRISQVPSNLSDIANSINEYLKNEN